MDTLVSVRLRPRWFPLTRGFRVAGRSAFRGRKIGDVDPGVARERSKSRKVGARGSPRRIESNGSLFRRRIGDLSELKAERTTMARRFRYNPRLRL